MKFREFGVFVFVVALAVFVFGGSLPPAQVRPASAIEGVTPVLECIDYDPVTKGMTATFGYVNKNMNPVTIPIGEANYFQPTGANQGQPTLFIPGQVEEAFTVSVSTDTYPVIRWTLLGTTVAADVGEGPYCTSDPANLSVTMSAPQTVTPGDDLTYDIEVSNAGPRTATGVTLVDALPGGVEFVSATPSSGTCSGTADVSCSIGEIPRDGEESVAIKVVPEQPGELVNTVNVAMNESDLVPLDNFTTARTSVTATAPQVVRTSPADGARKVPFTSSISAAFSSDMDLDSLTDSTFVLERDGVTDPLAATVRYDADDRRAVLDPTSDLERGATYTATVLENVASRAGRPLAAPKSWTFTVTSDDVAPVVTAVKPQAGSRDVARAANVTATFSEEMREGTLTSNTVRLQKRGTTERIPAALDYDSSTETVTLDPEQNLVAGTAYTVILTTGVRDRAGNRLSQSRVWYFKVAQ